MILSNKNKSTKLFSKYPTALLLTVFNTVVFFLIIRLLYGNQEKTLQTPSAPQETSAAINGPLRKSAQNPRYFTDNSGKAIYLTGSHTWPDVFEIDKPSLTSPDFDFNGYLNFLDQKNHNFIRGWVWELAKYQYDSIAYAYPHPWQRTGPGNAKDGQPKFDLTKFNQSFFDRLSSRVSQAQLRGKYISIMLFEGHGLKSSKAPWNWDGHPFNPANNINGIDGQFLKVHSLDIPAVTNIQDAYVRKVIDTVNGFDNVLYEIANEDGGGTVAWQEHIVSLIRSYEQTKPKKHMVGMTFRYPTGSNSELFNSSADWISPNSDGGYRDNPPVADGKKVVILDTDHLGGIWGDGSFIWKAFLRGYNPIYMDPYNLPGNGTPDVSARNAMGHTLSYANKMNLLSMKPQTTSCSTQYCLVNTGTEYLVYQPAGGPFNVSTTAGTYSFEWFNVTTGKVAGTGLLTVAGPTTFTPPFSGSAVLYLKKADSTSPSNTPTGTNTNTPTRIASATPTSAKKPGDCDGDGFVDLFDYGYLSRSFGLTQGQAGFDGRCDFYKDANNIIDLFDYQILANNFGR